MRVFIFEAGGGFRSICMDTTETFTTLALIKTSPTCGEKERKSFSLSVLGSPVWKPRCSDSDVSSSSAAASTTSKSKKSKTKSKTAIEAPKRVQYEL